MALEDMDKDQLIGEIKRQQREIATLREAVGAGLVAVGHWMVEEAAGPGRHYADQDDRDSWRGDFFNRVGVLGQ